MILCAFERLLYPQKSGTATKMWGKRPKIEEIMDIEAIITFFLFIVWQWLIYEKYSIFYKDFEKQHRGTQKTTRTQNLGPVGFIGKNGEKAIPDIGNFLGFKSLENDVLRLEIGKTHQNSKICKRNSF